MQFPVFIELRRPRLFVILLVLIHALAGVCVLLMRLSWFCQLPAFLIIAVSLWRALRSPEVRSLRIINERKLQIRRNNGENTDVEVLAESALFSFLLILSLQPEDSMKKIRLTLLPDQMEKEQFRCLRLWLKWRSHEQEPHFSETPSE